MPFGHRARQQHRQGIRTAARCPSVHAATPTGPQTRGTDALILAENSGLPARVLGGLKSLVYGTAGFPHVGYIRYGRYELDPTTLRAIRAVGEVGFLPGSWKLVLGEKSSESATASEKEIQRRLLSWASSIHPDPRGLPGVLFELRIVNVGNTTLQNVRLNAAFLTCARILRNIASPEEISKLSGQLESQQILIGSLAPEDEVTVLAWGQSQRSAQTFRLTHAEGRGRIRILHPGRLF